MEPRARAARPVGLTFLGGLGRIGRNCLVLEIDHMLLLIDCGQMFAYDAAPGVEAILPDFTWIHERAEDVVGCVCTHGHEDHIGGLPYLLGQWRRRPLPIFGAPFTLGLLRHKLGEAGVADRAELIPLTDGERRRIGPFDCEFLPVTHSIPSGHMTVVRTPQGVVVHSGDLKIDSSPVDGRITDLHRLGEIADGEGVRLLLADSTNADLPGWTRSETQVGEVLGELFAQYRDRRLIVASFASHVHRLQQVADHAVASGRTVVPLGQSMVRSVQVARELGVMRIPDRFIADAELLPDLDRDETCVICTGSQGEARSALWQMANGESPVMRLRDDDVVVFSSHPIPGNEAAVAHLRNALAGRGVEIVHSGMAEVHASGHARQGELTELHRTARPEWFVPVHGERAHLVAHARLAERLGMARERVLVCLTGDSLVLDDQGLTRGPAVRSDEVYVDGTVGGVDAEVLLQRQVLGQEGFVAVWVILDLGRARRVAGPEVVSRGWSAAHERQHMHEAVATSVAEATDRMLEGPEVASVGLADVERVVRRAAGARVNETTRRRPMIVPVVRLM